MYIFLADFGLENDVSMEELLELGAADQVGKHGCACFREKAAEICCIKLT